MPAAIKAKQVATGTPGTVGVGDAAAEGTSQDLARADHTHAVTAPGAPEDVTKAAAAAGVATTVARSDHKHDVSTAATGTVGGANAEGTATSLARSDHDHAVDDLVMASQAQGNILYFNGSNWVVLAPGNAGQHLETNGAAANPSWEDPPAGTPQQEAVTTENITGTDTAITDTLDNTPVSNASVSLYLNGVLQDQGAGKDYTLSGVTITWLASTGTAVDMVTTDDLTATYES